MAAATVARNTPRLATDLFGGPARYRPMNGGSAVLAGTIGCLNNEGNLVPGTAATALVAEGRCEDSVDNTAGADGALSCNVRPGTYKWANSTSTDAITIADVGKPCFVVDNQTVARLSATEARSPAGMVSGITADGVWVEMSLEISLLILTRLDTLVVP